MIDHLLRFDDEAAARAALPDYYMPGSEGEPGSWRGDCCIPGVQVYDVTGTETLTDPETGTEFEHEIREAYSGWFVVIALSGLDDALRDLPGNACRLITDRDAASRGENFVLYTAPDLEPGVLSAAKVEPTFAGSSYPFGAAA